MNKKTLSEKTYITKKNALIYYDELLKNYNYDTRYLYIKVPCLKSIMEYEILKEVTGISHFKNPYELGQLKWLKDRIEKRNKNGDIIGDGFVKKQLISGNEHLFDQRNIAEHDKKMSKAIYKGLFAIVADTINLFSGIDIPKEIIDICEDKDSKPKKNVNDSSNKKPKANNKNVKSDYYFVNTGISDDPKSRNWDNNIKYKYISAGNDKRYIDRIRTLSRGDKIFAFITKKGYVGYGIVEEEAVLVKKFYVDKKNSIRMIDNLPDDHKWKKEKDQNIDEWIVKIDWKKTVKENEAKPLKGYVNNVCRLPDDATLKKLKKEFGIE